MRIIQNLPFGVLLFFSAAVLNGQTALNTLDDIARFGTENNLGYKNDQLNVRTAEENREGILQFEHSSISVSGGMGIIDLQSNSNPSYGFSSTLSVPVIEQVSLVGTITDDLSGQVGISLNPLAHSAGSRLTEIEYSRAMVSAESSRISAENGALSASLQWMSANRELKAQKVSADLAEIKYNDDKIRYDMGEITLDDLQQSLIDWSESRVTLSEKQVNYRNSESALYRSLGAGPEEVSLKILEAETINSALTELKSSLDPQAGNPMKNDEYVTSLLNAQSSETAYRNTWFYEPDMRAGATLDFDSSGTVNVSASLEFSLSPDDFQNKQRDIAREAFLISKAEAEQTLNEVQLGFEQVLETIDISEINSEISLLEYEQAKILFSEAELLRKMGDYSEIELQESQLTLVHAENALFRALADEYQAWLELKKYL